MAKPLVLKENKVPRKTGWPRMSLERFFAVNVVELRFKRRINPPFSTRRMLCTSNWRLVRSPLARNLFRFTPPKGKMRRGMNWYRQRRLLITWDLMKNDWRCISLDSYEIVGFAPAKELLEQAKFVAFYRKNIVSLPQGKKDSFSHQQ